MAAMTSTTFPELTAGGYKLRGALISPISGHHGIFDVAGVQCVLPWPDAVKKFLAVLLANINHAEIEEALRQAFLTHVGDWNHKTPYDLEDYFAAYTSAANLQFPDTLRNKDYRKVHKVLHKIATTLLGN